MHINKLTATLEGPLNSYREAENRINLQNYYELAIEEVQF
jgi:hypothetical protein